MNFALVEEMNATSSSRKGRCFDGRESVKDGREKSRRRDTGLIKVIGLARQGELCSCQDWSFSPFR